ncbi:MAG: AbiJ-NTD4 domain-containing protein [Dyella sp.]|uniref:AbiJ-NTD4 domain-containing protein n=1 Tax=Dyella sp. TaxID=1869338 RepID=UPI003F7F0974
MRFSARLAANSKRQLVLEDAPRPLRVGYIKGILGKFVGETIYLRQRGEQPLDTRETHLAFIALIREEADPWDFDNESNWSALSHHLKECQWSNFYDFVELVGSLLLEKDDEIPFDQTCDFKSYQSQVNALLVEDGIGWTLNEKSELVRIHPKVLAESLVAAEQKLGNRFEQARAHYQKAARYLHRHPIDEANSIKEIVSALESVARTIEPKASTLGEAIKRLKRDPKYSSSLLDPLEKLYAYSNGAAAVRHGHATGSGPSVADAELALLIGVGYIRYLIEISERDA